MVQVAEQAEHEAVWEAIFYFYFLSDNKHPNKK
jgi:hypothetical protein